MENNKRPVIGITSVFSQERGGILLASTYIDSVRKSDAAAFVFPQIESADEADRLVRLCDGIIFSGGEDVDPSLYGEKPCSRLGAVSAVRDRTEKLIFDSIKNTSKPILGICRGAQFVNVCMGGSLWQDIPSQYVPQGTPAVDHGMTAEDASARHFVSAKPGSIAAGAYGKLSFPVNSYHHQAVKEIGKGLCAAAFSQDGLIEALQSDNDRYVLLVQWHPEKVFDESIGAQKLFESFIKACRQQ